MIPQAEFTPERLDLRAASVSKSLFFSFILSFSSLRRRSLPVTLTTTFTPAGGTAQPAQSRKVLLKRKK